MNREDSRRSEAFIKSISEINGVFTGIFLRYYPIIFNCQFALTVTRKRTEIIIDF